MADVEDLPNIPGIRRNPTAAKRVAQTLKFAHGVGYHDQDRKGPPPNAPEDDHALLTLDLFRNTSHVKQSNKYNDLSGRYALRNQKRDYINKASGFETGN